MDAGDAHVMLLPMRDPAIDNAQRLGHIYGADPYP
jgi:hypothetical protein